MSILKRSAVLMLLAAFTANAAFADDASIVLPEPPAASTEMILGDSSADQSQEVTLYFSGENNLGLTSSTRSIPVRKNESLVENAVAYLLRSRFSENVQSSAAADVQLIDLEYACGVATVDLSIGSSAQLNDQAELLRCTAIANTLLGIEGVKAVNILTGSRSDAICSLPIGAFTQLNEAISASYAQLQSEREDFLTSGISGIRRNAVLYFPSSNGYLLPELRVLDFHSDDYAAVIYEALKAGPTASAQCFSPIPVGDDLLHSAPFVHVNSAGERILEMSFSSMLPNYLAFSGMEPWQFYGSIVLSMCSFIPGLDGVRLSIEGAAISECAIGDRIVRFSGDLMRRNDFTAKIGSSTYLYYNDAEGKLVPVSCPLSQANAASPKGILSSLISMPVPAGYTGVFPEGITADDILGVELDGGIANVNLSGSFYAICQSLNDRQERSMIYAMVNSLCELPGIGAASFRIEGMTLESLSRNIYLKTHLLPDPGTAE